MIKTRGLRQDLDEYDLFLPTQRLNEDLWHRYGIELNTGMA